MQVDTAAASVLMSDHKRRIEEANRMAWMEYTAVDPALSRLSARRERFIADPVRSQALTLSTRLKAAVHRLRHAPSHG